MVQDFVHPQRGTRVALHMAVFQARASIFPVVRFRAVRLRGSQLHNVWEMQGLQKSGQLRGAEHPSLAVQQVFVGTPARFLAVQQVTPARV